MGKVQGSCLVSAVVWKLSCVSCPVSAVVWQLSCASCRVTAVLCQLSCDSCTVSAVLCQLSCVSCRVTAVVCQLSCDSCRVSAVTPASCKSRRSGEIFAEAQQKLQYLNRFFYPLPPIQTVCHTYTVALCHYIAQFYVFLYIVCTVAVCIIISFFVIQISTEKEKKGPYNIG